MSYRLVNKAERILLAGSNMWYFGEGMLGPLFAIFTERVGGDILDIAWAWAAYLIVTGVLMIVFGKMGDRLKNTAVIMVVGYALNALFTFGYLLVDSPLDLLIIQVGLGVASAMATPTWDALYTKHEARKESSFLWGISEGTALITTGIGMIIGGFVIKFSTFTTLFWIMGSIQILATLYQLQSLRKKYN